MHPIPIISECVSFFKTTSLWYKREKSQETVYLKHNALKTVDNFNRIPETTGSTGFIPLLLHVLYFRNYCVFFFFSSFYSKAGPLKEQYVSPSPKVQTGLNMLFLIVENVWLFPIFSNSQGEIILNSVNGGTNREAHLEGLKCCYE